MVGHHISNELKEMALSMFLQGLRDSEIQEFTGKSVCSLKCLQSTYHQNGEVAWEHVLAYAHYFEQRVQLGQKSQEKIVFLNIFSSLITTNIFGWEKGAACYRNQPLKLNLTWRVC